VLEVALEGQPKALSDEEYLKGMDGNIGDSTVSASTH
jgi:hypothetical protein